MPPRIRRGKKTIEEGFMALKDGTPVLPTGEVVKLEDSRDFIFLKHIKARYYRSVSIYGD